MKKAIIFFVIIGFAVGLTANSFWPLGGMHPTQAGHAVIALERMKAVGII